MKIFILIPVHNNISSTIKCIQCLNQQSWKDFEIIVIDDGSEDGTADILAREYPSVTVLSGNGNLWWTGAINKGVKYVLTQARSGDYVLTLNNDLEFDKDYLSTLVEAARLRPTHIIGSISKDINNHDHVLYSGSDFDWDNRKNIAKPSINSIEDRFNENTFSIPGRGMFIPVNVFQKIGFFNEKKLPHYGADVEFTIRAKRNGINLSIDRAAILYSDTTVSGLKFDPSAPLSIKDAWQLLTSRKSKMQIATRWNYLMLCCPRKFLPKYLIVEFKQWMKILLRVNLWCLRNR